MRNIYGKRHTQRETYAPDDARMTLRKASDGSFLGVEIRYYSGTKQQTLAFQFDPQAFLKAVREEMGE